VLSMGLANESLTGGAGSDVFYAAAGLLHSGVTNTITDLSWATGAAGQTDRIHIEGLADPTKVTASLSGGNALLSVPASGGGTSTIQITGDGAGLLTVEFQIATTPAANLGSLATQNLANLTIGNFDVNGAFNYSATFTSYNSSGLATTGDTYYDTGANAGGRDHTTYDPANAQPYSSVVDTYNAAGQQTAQAGNRDDAGFVGFTWQTLFDVTNTQTYANFTNTYEPAAASGAVFQQSLAYDAGQTFGSSFTQYDPLSQQNYSQYQNFYLPNGQVFQQNGHYDTGADAGHDWITTYDTPGTQTYTSYTNVYNSGAILYQTGAFDGGQYSGDSWVTVYATPGSTAHYDQNIYKPDGSVAAHIVV